MANPTNTLARGTWSPHRSLSGSPGADPSLSSSFPGRRGFFATMGYETVLVRAKLAGGTAPTVSLKPVFLDPDDDSSVQGSTVVLTGDGIAEVSTRQMRTFLRIDAVTGAPSAIEIRIAPGSPASENAA